MVPSTMEQFKVITAFVVGLFTIFGIILYINKSNKAKIKKEHEEKLKKKESLEFNEDESDGTSDNDDINNLANYKNLMDTSRDNDILYGKTKNYTWNQNENEIEMFIPLDMFANIDSVRAKDVKTYIKANTLKIIVNEKEIINGKLYDKILPDDSNWQLDTLNDKTKQIWITLYKAAPTIRNKHWKSLLIGDEEIDVSKLGPPIHGIDTNDKTSIKNAIEKVKLLIY